MAEQPITNPTIKAQGPTGGPRPSAAGQRRRRPKSRYGAQLEEKQNLKKIYGIREAQLKKYFVSAVKSKEQTGDKLMRLLEARLDNAVFRASFAETRPAARQLSSHRMFELNGKPVDVPSISLRPGDIVKVKSSKLKKGPFANFVKRMQGANPPSWLKINAEDHSFTVVTEPDSVQASVGLNIQAIVEYFARKV